MQGAWCVESILTTFALDTHYIILPSSCSYRFQRCCITFHPEFSVHYAHSQGKGGSEHTSFDYVCSAYNHQRNFLSWRRERLWGVCSWGCYISDWGRGWFVQSTTSWVKSKYEEPCLCFMHRYKNKYQLHVIACVCSHTSCYWKLLI